MVGGYSWPRASTIAPCRPSARWACHSRYTCTRKLLWTGRLLLIPWRRKNALPDSSGIWAPHNYATMRDHYRAARAGGIAQRSPSHPGQSRSGQSHQTLSQIRDYLASGSQPATGPGASDLTLLEHTSAFTTFPDDGVHLALRTVTRVTNYMGGSLMTSRRRTPM